MRITLFSIIMITFSIQGFSQVAAPSLDPSNANSLPSVTSLRYHNTIAFGYESGDLEQEDGNADYTAMGGVIGLNFDGLGLEANTNTFDLEGTFGGSGSPEDITWIRQSNQIGISYLLGGFLSIGVGQYTETNEFEGKVSGVLQFKDKSESTATMMSANIILAEVFFLGAGINSFTNTGAAEGGGGGADKQEIKWQETVVGAAVLFGEPGQFQLKAEYAIKSSPEAGETDSGQLLIRNGHKKTDTTVGIIEIKSGEYFISYTSKTINEAEIDSQYMDHDEGEKVTESGRLGIGYVNSEGLLLTFYSEKIDETEKDTYGDRTSEWNSMTFNVGYNF